MNEIKGKKFLGIGRDDIKFNVFIYVAVALIVILMFLWGLIIGGII